MDANIHQLDLREYTLLEYRQCRLMPSYALGVVSFIDPTVTNPDVIAFIKYEYFAQYPPLAKA